MKELVEYTRRSLMFMSKSSQSKIYFVGDVNISPIERRWRYAYDRYLCSSIFIVLLMTNYLLSPTSLTRGLMSPGGTMSLRVVLPGLR